MGKSAKEWYQHLPEPIRSQAVANSMGLNWQYSNLAECLLGNFIWTTSTQGSNYWDTLYARACAGEFDQPEPNLHGWIAVTDRLPTKEDGDKVGNVMIVSEDKTVSIMPVIWVVANNAICPFWQPLPKLPEVKGGENA